LILLATFASLRWGEVAALSRRNIDLAGGTVRIVELEALEKVYGLSSATDTGPCPTPTDG